MVSHLVGLPRSESMLEDLLRKVNCSKETVLHEAVRIGDNGIVKDLLEADPELACFPEEGTSPLHLAISLKEDKIAEMLHDESKDKVLSYSGPNGQNALHAAVLRGPVLTRRLLEWNKDLATKSDENGSTPLHFAAGCQSQSGTVSEISQLLEANTTAMYQPDHQGLFPIHVAASVGERDMVDLFVKKFHSSSRLRDAKGRTFLHVAVEKERWGVVGYACSRKASLAWILNMQDNDGNTALHLAVKAMDIGIFSLLVSRLEVNLNLTNAKGETPLDIAEYMIPPRLSGRKGSQPIHYLLQCAGATRGVSRRDNFKEKSEFKNIHEVKADCETKQAKILKESSQSLLVGSALVASVTFGAAFAMPGGYRQDDHPRAGTPTLAGSLWFNGFVIADVTAFFLSSLATVGFMYSGNSKAALVRREIYFSASMVVLHTSILAMVAAFGMGMAALLPPSASPLITMLYGLCSLLLAYVYFNDYFRNWVIFIEIMLVRKRLILSLWRLALCLSVFIFILFSQDVLLYAGYILKIYFPMSESPAQPPAPAPLA